MNIVTTGITTPTANRNDTRYYAPITSLAFPTVQQGTLPSAGSKGTLVLKKVPPFANYVKGQGILYQNSNNHNTVRMTVEEVVGPTKYNVIAV